MIDRKLCEMIIKEYYSDIMSFCLAKLNDEEAARDCAQETFVLFFEKRKKLDLSENIKVWLLSAAANVIRNYTRNNWRRVDDDAEILEKKNADENIQKRAELKEAFSELSDEEAEILVRYYKSDKGERQQIADELGITINNLYVKIKRIKDKLLGKTDK